MKKTTRKLTLDKQTIVTLTATNLRDVAGGLPPLTFFPCNTANCMTLGPLCRTHDCTLTFTSC